MSRVLPWLSAGMFVTVALVVGLLSGGFVGWSAIRLLELISPGGLP